MNHIVRYVQGTVWHWSRGTNDRYEKGVQGDERPVLIISNNVFNASSPVVNCVTITSALKDSPVHVPVYLYQHSHIQCEQIHTIRKTNLKYYKGTIPQSTLIEVKEKLKFQFDMDDAIFNKRNKEVESTLREILEEVSLGFKDSKRDMYVISLVRDLLVSQAELNKNFIAFANSHHVIDEPEVFVEPTEAGEAAAVDNPPKMSDVVEDKKQEVKVKKEYRKYTDEDILYIVDEDNTAEDLMNKFGLADKKSAYNLRNRMKKRF